MKCPESWKLQEQRKAMLHSRELQQNSEEQIQEERKKIRLERQQKFNTLLERVKNARIKNWKAREKDYEMSFVETPNKKGSVITALDDKQSYQQHVSFHNEGHGEYMSSSSSPRKDLKIY